MCNLTVKFNQPVYIHLVWDVRFTYKMNLFTRQSTAGQIFETKCEEKVHRKFTTM